jgi:hypothetical protein
VGKTAAAGGQSAVREASGETSALQSDLSRRILARSDTVIMAEPNPESRAWAELHYPGRRVEQVCPARFNELVREDLGPRLLDEAVDGLERRFPELSARRVMTRAQVILFTVLAVSLLAGLIWNPSLLLRAVTLFLSVLFIASGLFRTLLALLGGGALIGADLPRPGRAGLPTYSILVPMYREAAVLPRLVQALQALDYPGIR